MKNRTLIAIIIVIVLSAVVYVISSSLGQNMAVVNIPKSEDTSIVYKNTNYGFNFSLPLNWQGYSIVQDTWKGSPLTKTPTQSGPKLIIRNPKWTESKPYEDLPILVFTAAQWEAYRAENFSIGAAPIQASELGRNNKYVFALPARWDFDYSLDFKEAQDIIASHPLVAFNNDLVKGGIIAGAPVFKWRYEKAKSLNLDGNPKTNVFLDVTYPSGAVENKLIDTTPGSCNDLPDLDSDSVTNSTSMQCYSAGLGYYFKITKGETAYLVLRKTFKEASPDYNPPSYQYEKVSEFPFSK